ncbi:pre-mRNA-splicing factor ATP-dependent RNA helicase DEAH7-like [Cajanus cajan]|uniref:pre-mRNA-splicing factor ATP-dependent RNA helicase DEAH7-like n=1 Tax=Cajanus cajan TaxID=3821 RepID=UPI00098DC0DC|nr:pre-mRNA-splicing factor ATP-dependent RNA helicase DEAH7-like [Cajanus cajan]
MEKDRAGAGAIDIDKTTMTLEPEKPTGGGLYVPGKDRVVYVPPERKSRLGLDTLAIAKRAESQNDGGFKVPKERTTSIAASAEDEDRSESSVVEESGHDRTVTTRRHTNRRYREATSETSHAGKFEEMNHVDCKFVRRKFYDYTEHEKDHVRCKAEREVSNLSTLGVRCCTQCHLTSIFRGSDVKCGLIYTD